MGSKLNRGLLILLCFIVSLMACQDGQKKHRESIDEMMEKVSTAFEENKLTDSLALAAADLHVEYLESYPEDTSHNPTYYYKATQLYADAGKFDRSLQLIDTFLQQYPNHELRPYMLHFKGYNIYEQGLKNYPRAKKVYLEFLEEYPEHEELTDAVLFSLEHLGKPDNKVLEEILQKRKEQDSTQVQ